MDKLLQTLEKRVEWIAIGVGVLWVLYVGWTYGINQPASVEVGGTVYTPGEVDEKILDLQGNGLRGKLDAQAVPQMDVVPMADVFARRMNAQPLMTLVEAPVLSPNVRKPLEYVPGAVKTEIRLVDALPEVLAPTDPIAKAAVSYIMEQEGAPGAPVAPGAAPLQPVLTPPTPARPLNPFMFRRPGSPSRSGDLLLPPGRGAAPAAGAGVGEPEMVIPAGAVEKRYATAFAKYNKIAQLTKFADAKIPAAFIQDLMYLEVQLERQEVMPDGREVGKPALIPVLKRNKPPVDRSRNPNDFQNWATAPEIQHQIVQPDFYQIVAGDPLPQPVQEQVADVNLQPFDVVFDATAAVQSMKNMTEAEKRKFREKLPMEQRRALYLAEQAEKEREANEKRMQRTGGGTGTNPRDTGRSQPRGGPTEGRRPGGMSGMDAQDPQIMREMFAQARPGRYDDLEAMRRRESARERERVLDPARNRMPDMRPFNPLVVGGLAADADGNIWIWAHDETVEPGRTYKYRLRIIVKNPIYNTNLGGDAVVKTLDAVGKWSDWTKPVTIPSIISMQLVGKMPNSDAVRFNVWRFHQGKKQRCAQPFQVGPGDMVGGPTGSGPGAIDFTTGWTIVDIRNTGNDTRVVLVDSEGRAQTRYLRADLNNPEFKEETPLDATKGPLGLR